MDITVSISNQTFQQIKKDLGAKLSRRQEKKLKADIKETLEGFYGQSVVRDAIMLHEIEKIRSKDCRSRSEVEALLLSRVE